jgi:hypothetical protein
MEYNPHQTIRGDSSFHDERFHHRSQDGGDRCCGNHGRLSPRRNHHHLGENDFTGEPSYDDRASSGQNNCHQSRSRRSPSPRASYSGNRGLAPRHHHDQGRQRTTFEPHCGSRLERCEGHSPRPRTSQTYSRPQTSQGPRTPQRFPKGPRTPQRAEGVHRSSTPPRPHCHYGNEMTQWKRSPQQTRSPTRIKLSRSPRPPQDRGSSLRNRSPLRSRSPRSPNDQRHSLSAHSNHDSLQSPGPARSTTRPESDSPKRERGHQQPRSMHRESALKRLGPKRTTAERFKRHEVVSRILGNQKKYERFETVSYFIFSWMRFFVSCKTLWS